MTKLITISVLPDDVVGADIVTSLSWCTCVCSCVCGTVGVCGCVWDVGVCGCV